MNESHDRARLSMARRLDGLSDRFEEALFAGDNPRIEDYVESDSSSRLILLLELVQIEIEYRGKKGLAVDDYLARFPELAQNAECLARLRSTYDKFAAADVRPVQSGRKVEFNQDSRAAIPQRLPASIGRYRVERVLGKGGFGVVYLAYDGELTRPVAVKVPHPELISREEDAQAYLAEARTVANLDHPNIVPVYDVGSTAEFPVYVVSKYVDGGDLAASLSQSRMNRYETAELVATVAEAVHYAHKLGLYHRDLKPGNILLDISGRPFVVDFGLALRERDVGKGTGFVGTPAYMSPEQARGEGHRIDGRSDIFSLGVLMYEMLLGRRPFHGNTREELLEQISAREAQPPRQVDDSLPRELERICLKALSKRATDRYTTARDLAEDLQTWLAAAPESSTAMPTPSSVAKMVETPVPVATPATTSRSDSRPIRIVPKGLRSFDEHDADFFLELLPGPRDRDGLPEIIRFWKTRIEETDSDKTFSVALIYGPSGCGKSSLLKAGVLPRLSKDVSSVYVEATADQTEIRLLNGLRKRCPTLPDGVSLPGALTALRQRHVVAGAQKVLIVLDQFEQWLHGRKDEQNTDLVQALRQCDGAHVQCLVMVRDDFWMAVTRFMDELEVVLTKGQNMQASDLFDRRHARRVLEAFGRAFGVLPNDGVKMSKDQLQFIEQAVAELAEEGKVICVQLALFAETMKGQPWTPATLKKVGGIAGVGVAFLEETMGSSACSPTLRLHQKAARALLKALLPEPGADIKGRMCSRADLQGASGYANRSRDFDDLLRILDGEVRLITPIDSEVAVGDGESQIETKSGEKYYQLTHDYLVPSLRDWLTRKQRATWRGRAELRLAGHSALWNAKRESSSLPPFLQYANIRLFTRRRKWTVAERRLMSTAGAFHAMRAAIALCAVALVIWLGWELNGRMQGTAGVESLLAAETKTVPELINKVAHYRRWADPQLRIIVARELENSKQRLHASLALVPVDRSQVDFLYARLLQAEPEQISPIRDVLEAHLGRRQPELIETLWEAAQATGGQMQDRHVLLRAASALAKLTPGDARWEQTAGPLAEELVGVSSHFVGYWLDALEPIQPKLVEPLIAVSRNDDRADLDRLSAAAILTRISGGDLKVMCRVIADANPGQFSLVFAKLLVDRSAASRLLEAELVQNADSDDDAQLEARARRQAKCAVALCKLGRATEVWPKLEHSRDPRLRSYIIHWLALLDVDPHLLLNQFDQEPDATIRSAILLALGEFSESQLPEPMRERFCGKLLNLYEEDGDSGLHGAAEWLLRRWKQESRLNELIAKLKDDDSQLVARCTAENRRWYVNAQGQTFAILDAGQFEMGTPPGEPGHQSDELRHHRRIGRPFAIAMTEITKGQFGKFQSERPDVPKFHFSGKVRSDDSPQTVVDWYEAAAYCNWLSEKDGIPEDQWCYVPNDDNKFAAGMKPKRKHLELIGYRLPTEAEWEFACRADTITSRYYGQDENLLSHYAWFLTSADDRTWPVGSLKPNDFGLFDMLGNAFEWCEERYRDPYPDIPDAVLPDAGDEAAIVESQFRIARGGAFGNLATHVRSGSRNGYVVPGSRYYGYGFRPARTCRRSNKFAEIIALQIIASPESPHWCDPGRAMICVTKHLPSGVKAEYYGFYPRENVDEMFVGSLDLEGEFKKEPSRFSNVSWSLEKEIDGSQYQAVMTLIEDANAGRYGLTSGTCVDFVYDVVAAAGWRNAVKRRLPPDRYVRELYVKNVDKYEYDGGVFERVGSGTWIERVTRDNALMTFTELDYNDTWLFLRDKHRKLDLRIPLRGGEYQWRTTDDWQPMQTVTPVAR